MPKDHKVMAVFNGPEIEENVNMFTFVVSTLIVNKEGYVLAQKRKRDGCWEFAGGKVEPLEGMRDAARREIAEELGLDVVIDDFICSLLLSRKGPSIFYVQFYTGHIFDEDNDEIFIDNDAVSEVQWVDLLNPKIRHERTWLPATTACWNELIRAVHPDWKELFSGDLYIKGRLEIFSIQHLDSGFLVTTHEDEEEYQNLGTAASHMMTAIMSCEHLECRGKDLQFLRAKFLQWVHKTLGDVAVANS